MQNLKTSRHLGSRLDKEISRIAFSLWKEAGWPLGRFMECWELAEREVMGSRQLNETQVGMCQGASASPQRD